MSKIMPTAPVQTRGRGVHRRRDGEPSKEVAPVLEPIPSKAKQGRHIRPRVFTTIALLAVNLIACAPKERSGGLIFSIDPGLQPEPRMLSNRPLAAVRDTEGRTSVFIANEVILSPQNGAELERFLARYGGSVVANDAVPEPPAGFDITIDPAVLQPTQYTVRLDASTFPLDDFIADAARAGFGGEVTISSGLGARLLALITHARTRGLRVSPNFIGEGDLLLRETREHPTSTGFENAFDWTRFGTIGSKASVTRAWQIVAARGFRRSHRIAVIDSGFWLDPTGRPLSAATGSDLPVRLLQYDLVANDYVAAGMSLAPCTGGSPCPWHGNGSAGVATGILDNQYGGAGTGGLVAEPMLFLTDLSWDQVSRGIRTAVVWGADVISMSFGAECDNVFCDAYYEFNLYPALRNAHDNGVVAVASACNDSQWTNSVPCKGDAVICVGALKDDMNTSKDYSNFGTHVDIWAPTDIPTMPDGNSGSNLAVHQGTSAAAPFVAGVAAMIKACDPVLTPDEVNYILRETAWTDSPDSKVTHYINAFRAVSKACGNSSPILQVYPDSVANAPTNRDLSIARLVFDPEDGFPCPDCPVSWEPEPARFLGSTAIYRFPRPGSLTIVVTARDSDGDSTRVEVPVRTVNLPPTAFIAEPVQGQAVPRGEPVTLRGFGLDPNEGPGPESGRLENGCRWTSNVGDDPFPVAQCAASKVFAANGTRTLTLTVEDSLGAVSNGARVVITVRDPPVDRGPAASITLSEPNYLDQYGVDLPISLEGAASGDPDTPYTWEWTAISFDFGSSTHLSAGPITIGEMQELTWVPLSMTGLIAINDLRCSTEGQWVRITLRVTDAHGNPGRVASRLIKVFCRMT